MKLLTILPLLLIFSCIDMLSEDTTHYSSIYFEGGSWIEIDGMDNMRLDPQSNEYTLQFWDSGPVSLHPIVIDIVKSNQNVTQIKSENINLNISASEITKKNILDYGCGVGDAAYIFDKLSPATITGIDIGESNIHFCKNNKSFNISSHMS